MYKLTTEKSDLTEYLIKNTWIAPNEQLIQIEKPGEGNMNFTLRIVTGERRFIIKQSREYVEKYPQVAAPKDRVLREAEFYQLIQALPALAKMMPNIIGLDKDNSILLMEDLGEGADYSFLYKTGQTIAEAELMKIMAFAAKLHTGITTTHAPIHVQNLEMRVLNHEHIFNYPFLPNNGLDLDCVLPGLKAASLSFVQDDHLKQKAAALGAIYLADGPALLHGDYFPGSWLTTNEGVKIIDPEFCFFGPPEFEIGVTIAHLLLADQPNRLIENALDYYVAFSPLDDTLRQQFTAIEILRRILGLAQLPLQIDLGKRVQLMDWARVVLKSMI